MMMSKSAISGGWALGWWLVLLGVMGLGSGCERKEGCAKEEVVCADELIAYSSPPSFTTQVGLSFSLPPAIDGNGFDWTQFPFQVTIEDPKNGTQIIANAKPDESSHGVVYFFPPLSPLTRVTVTSWDKAPIGRTTVSSTYCVGANKDKVDCGQWALANQVSPTKVGSSVEAESAARNVRCQKLTYSEADGNADVTWYLKSPFSYEFTNEPKVMGKRFAPESKNGPFLAGGSDFNMDFDPDIVNPKQVIADVGYAMHLPMRLTYADLVPASGSAPDTLLAGWSIQKVAVGCTIKQSVLHGILTTATDKLPAGGTVHVLFNPGDASKPSGENGWCYYQAGPGDQPSLKAYQDTKAGAVCEKMM